MTSEIFITKLTKKFFDALARLDFKRCNALLGEAESAMVQAPIIEPWYLYLSAILVDECENDWPSAEALYNQVLVHAYLSDSLYHEVLQSLTIAYRKQGAWADALQHSRSALEQAKQLDDPFKQIKTLNEQAIICNSGFKKGDFGVTQLSLAEKCCEDALSILQNAGKSKEKQDVELLKRRGMINNTLGNIYLSMRKTQDAAKCFGNFLAVAQELKNSNFVAHSFEGLGLCYEANGKSDEAYASYKKALEFFKKQNDQLNSQQVLANLGYLHQQANEYEEALSYYDQALTLIDAVIAGLKTEESRTNFATTVADVYANAVLVCNKASEDKKIDLESQMSYRVRAFNYTELARSRSFLDLLENGSLEFKREYRAQPLTLSDVQAALPEDALLLAYFSTGVIESPEAVFKKGEYRRHRFPDDRILLFAVTRASIQLHMAALRPNDLYPKDRTEMTRRHFLRDEIRRTLYKLLVAPFDDLLQNRRVLYVVPHGPLHYLPFQAMTMSNGQTLLNADGPQLVYAPSASILLWDAHLAMERTAGQAVTNLQDEASKNVPRSLRNCLAIGYNGAGPKRLLLAENEASAIAKLTDGDALVGRYSKKGRFFDIAAEYRHLFFSCHGVFDGLNPLNSYLFIGESDDEKLSAKEVLAELDITRCALVFLSACQSGLNKVQRGDELFGLTRAFLYAGASSLIVTQWSVDECSTRIAIEYFCSSLKSGFGCAESLRQTQLYLQSLTKEDVQDILDGYRFELDNGFDTEARFTDSSHYLAALLANSEPGELIFADPFYWAPFILIGDGRLG